MMLCSCSSFAHLGRRPCCCSLFRRFFARSTYLGGKQIIELMLVHERLACSSEVQHALLCTCKQTLTLIEHVLKHLRGVLAPSCRLSSIIWHEDRIPSCHTRLACRGGGQVVTALVERHKAARALVTDDVVRAFMAKRDMPFASLFG